MRGWIGDEGCNVFAVAVAVVVEGDVEEVVRDLCGVLRDGTALSWPGLVGFVLLFLAYERATGV